MDLGPTLYVCEVTGDDAKNDGTTTQKPLKTPVRAIELGAGTILVRKATEGEGSEYASISGAALKKAKKAYEVNKRKAEKEVERLAKEAELAAQKAESEQKRLEDAKKLVLKKPDTPATKVSLRRFTLILPNFGIVAYHTMQGLP